MHAQQGLGLENGAIGNWSPIIHGLSKDHMVYNNQVTWQFSLLSGMIGGMTNRQNFKYFYDSFLAFFHDCGIQAPFRVLQLYNSFSGLCSKDPKIHL